MKLKTKLNFSFIFIFQKEITSNFFVKQTVTISVSTHLNERKEKDQNVGGKK
jgi:hypothetical protein